MHINPVTFFRTLLIPAACFLFTIILPVSEISALSNEEYDKLRVYSDVLSIIQTNYVNEKKSSDIIYDSIKGMVKNLDPYSSFMPPLVYKELQVETKGKFGGLGIEISIKDRYLIIVSPIEDTPAFLAGLKPGDKIIRIEDNSTKDMDIMDAIKLMRGEPGTKIKITIERNGLKKPKNFVITRAIINIKSVKPKVINNRYGYIRITQFQENTTNDFKNALNSLLLNEQKIIGLIIDLRSNPGGLLTQAVNIIDQFLDEGLIVYTDGRIASQNLKYHANNNSKKYNFNIVILVNKGSASASEIVAGSLQDHKRAIIIGRKTFGKGTVQTIFPLIDGSGLRLTTAKYYLPSKRSIHGSGIEPDINIEIKKDNETSQSEDILKIKSDDPLKDPTMIKAMEVIDNWEQHEKIFSKNKLTKNYMPPETAK
jgi:carboxyl-terminal processing protease